MRHLLEKLLPKKFWQKPAMTPERYWAAFAAMNDDNGVYRALMHEVTDWFMQNALVAFDRDQPADKRLAAADVAGEMAKLVQRIEEYRSGAKEQVAALEAQALADRAK